MAVKFDEILSNLTTLQENHKAFEKDMELLKQMTLNLKSMMDEYYEEQLDHTAESFNVDFSNAQIFVGSFKGDSYTTSQDDVHMNGEEEPNKLGFDKEREPASGERRRKAEALKQALMGEDHHYLEGEDSTGWLSRTLRLSLGVGIWDEKKGKGFGIGGVNKLSNLRQLALLLLYFNKLDLLALTSILDACPLLHKFHLSMRLPSTFNGKQAEKRIARHHTQLKDVEFSGFSGTEHEYDFILYILKNVVSLERLSIFEDFRSYEIVYGRWVIGTYRNPRDDKKKHRVIRKRLQGQAISKNAEIIIM